MSKVTVPALTLLVGDSADVLGFGAAETLALVAAERRRQDEAAARELRAVAHWADLHRVVDGTVGAVDPMLAHPGHDPLLGREGELRLLGEGAFTVQEFAVTQLASTLGMSERAARSYVGQTLELRERLPRLWGRVMDNELPAWKGRQIAGETIPLNTAATTGR